MFLTLNTNDKAMNKRETILCPHGASTLIPNLTVPYICNNTVSSFKNL